MTRKLIILFLILSAPGICRADYELRLNDGVTLMWREYSVEGDQYCTRKEFRKFCIQKRDVLSLKDIKGEAAAASDAGRIIVSTPAKKPTLRIIAGIPVTGIDTPGVNYLDEVMLHAMSRIGCSGATMAVADHGALVYSRGYGWTDKEKKVPLQPDAMIGIASCDKPVTAAAVKQLARDGRFDLDAGVFALLNTKPSGPVTDPRMNSITIRNLLEHKAGWGPDPVAGFTAVQRKSDVTNPVFVEAALSFLMTQKLKHDPGTVSEYCNFGYDTLRYIVQKFSGKRPDDYFRTVLFRPDSVRGFYGIGSTFPRNAPPLIWNAEAGGPVSASAPALLTFMRNYWLTGEPRDSGNPLWIMYGSLDGSTAMTIWRSDGIDLVALFNGRGNVSHDEIARDLQAVIDRLKDDNAGSLRNQF